MRVVISPPIRSKYGSTQSTKSGTLVTQAIPVRTLAILLVEEEVAEADILDPDSAAQCLPTAASLVSFPTDSLHFLVLPPLRRVTRPNQRCVPAFEFALVVNAHTNG